MKTLSHEAITRNIALTSSLHFDTLADYRAAGDGELVVTDQTQTGLDNGYGLQGNPTNHQLQAAISALEHGTHTLLYPSGLTALTAVQALLASGDHWLLPDSVYGPMRRFADVLKRNYQIDYDVYDPHDLATLEAAITNQTKLIHIETPGSVTYDVMDVPTVVKLARKHDLVTVADNTWASGELYQPLSHGVDVSILSLTKYIAGHSDLFMGSLTVGNKDLYKKLAYHHRVYGYTVSPVSAMLVQRGLETLAVRMAEHGRRAQLLVDRLRGKSGIAKVYSVDVQQAQEFSGVNGLISVELGRVYSDEELQTLFSVLKTFKIGESWGGTRSLVLPFQPHEFSGRFNPPQGTIVRFHAGLEDEVLLNKDIEAFLAELKNFQK